MSKRAAAAASAIELPTQAQVGDKIRLKPESINAYANACKLAGYDDFNAYRIVTVIRTDNSNPGGGKRLFFEGAPHCYSSHDVQLAWSTEDERREMLRARGWKV